MRKLEELLNLPPMKEAIEDSKPVEETLTEIQNNKDKLVAIDSAIDKIDLALPTVTDLEASDKEMDDLSDLATNTFKDLMDLSYNVEPRFSGPIIQSASTLLGHAITAKMAKMDKKLKMVDLQLKKARLDQVAEKNNESHGAIDGKGIVLDRNTLLKAILAQSNKTDK